MHNYKDESQGATYYLRFRSGLHATWMTTDQKEVGNNVSVAACRRDYFPRPPPPPPPPCVQIVVHRATDGQINISRNLRTLHFDGKFKLSELYLSSEHDTHTRPVELVGVTGEAAAPWKVSPLHESVTRLELGFLKDFREIWSRTGF